MPNMGSFDRVALCAHALVHMLLCSVNIMKCLGTGRSSNSAAGQPQAIRPLFVFAAAANQAPGHTPEPRTGQATAATACDSDLAQGREPAGSDGFPAESVHRVPIDCSSWFVDWAMPMGHLA